MSEVQVQEKAKKATTTYTPVQMTDGRTVQFAGDRKVQKSVLTDDEGSYTGVQFDFRNGETRSLLLEELATAIVSYSSCHGLLQKVGDEWSGTTEVDDIVLTCDDILARLRAGNWESEARGSGDSMSGASVVIKALCEVSGKTVAEVKAFLDAKLAAGKESGLTRQKLYASFRNPTSKIGQVIRRLEDEKAAKNAAVNADELLAEFAG